MKINSKVANLQHYIQCQAAQNQNGIPNLGEKNLQ